MTSPRQRPPLTAFRNSISWFFFGMVFFYLLYSSSYILKKGNSNCSLPCDSDVIRTRETLQRVENSTNSSLTMSSNKMSNGTTRASGIQPFDTELKHIAFGVAASSSLWEGRKEYIKQWWRPGETRGVVWLDQKVSTHGNEGLPELRISGDTSKFKYTNTQGDRSALRISRVVTETLRLGMKDIRWFVMGDDDTVFLVENVVRVLSKYDHNQLYYIGCISESHVQNIVFSYAMAFGGGGFAISYPLAKELEQMHDRCLQRYPGLYGSDDRMHACMAEIGVPLTKEYGFHQVN